MITAKDPTVVTKTKATERAFRKWLQYRRGGIIVSYSEAAHGSTFGLPDAQVLLPGLPLLLPVEFKIGNYMRHDRERVKVSYLRAEQIAWHDTIARAGGKSCLLIGIPQGKNGWHTGNFAAYVQPDCRHEVLKNWRDGWPIESLTSVFNETDSVINIWAWAASLGLNLSAAVGYPHLPSAEPAGALKRAAR